MARLSFLWLLLLFGTIARGAESTWHGDDGQPLFTGSFSSADSQSVTITKADGSTEGIPLEKLSLADRALVLTHDKKDSEFQNATHQWTSSSGKFHVDAKAIRIDDDKVGLTRADGKILSVPLDKMATEDRAYLARLKLAVKKTDAEDNPFSSVEAFTGTTSHSAAKPVVTAPPKTIPRPPVISPRSAQSTSDFVDRNPSSELITGHTPTGIPTFTGPRGGTYHYSKSGNKVYSKKK